MNEDEDPDGYGSCDNCGADLTADDLGELCDQCEWWLDAANENNETNIPDGYYFRDDLDGGRLVKMPKFNEDRDWTYSEGCGCQVTFFHESGFRTSRMLPGPECTGHTQRHQTEERDEFMRRAKDELRFARDCDSVE